MGLIKNFITRNISKEYGTELERKIRKEIFSTLGDQIVTTDKLNEAIGKVLSGVSGVATKHEIIIGDHHKEMTGVFHEKFDLVLKMVSSDIPVFLQGPAGSGKNVICKQVSEALDLGFYFTNAVTQEYKLTGFIDAMGKYHETEFYKAFKDGGLFFLDEIDASIPEVLVILNAAIANRYFDFPCGKIEAHPNFRIIAAGNTFGTGANTVYTGRFSLDGASLDRFGVIEIDYDENIEKYLTYGDEELLEFCYQFRSIVKQAGINCIFSYRALSNITKLKGNLDVTSRLKICLTKELGKDDLNIIYGKLSEHFTSDKNKYVKGFRRLLTTKI